MNFASFFIVSSHNNRKSNSHDFRKWIFFFSIYKFSRIPISNPRNHNISSFVGHRFSVWEATKRKIREKKRRASTFSPVRCNDMWECSATIRSTHTQYEILKHSTVPVPDRVSRFYWIIFIFMHAKRIKCELHIQNTIRVILLFCFLFFLFYLNEKHTQNIQKRRIMLSTNGHAHAHGACTLLRVFLRLCRIDYCTGFQATTM